MKYNGNICNVCGRPITEDNKVPEKFTTSADFDTASKCVEIQLSLGVSYGPYADDAFLKKGGHICFDCFKQTVTGIPNDGIPF